MRTTIEISDEQRARLLALAAKRKVKGFSAIVQEALDQYIEGHEARAARVTAAKALRGALGDDEARALAEACRRVREDWR
ncbi:MAG: hypothetical protein QME96_02455 [Myxococcota bacterium]|nr:hypothetical protein [Myxococcota bacterium]